MSKVITIISQKGGVGKSTVARTAAVAYAMVGWDVTIIDADTQQETSNHWFARRLENPKANSNHLWCEKARGVNPIKRVRDQGTADLIIVDGAPHATDMSVMFAKQSDLIIIPTGAAIDDLQPAIKLAVQLVSVHGVDREKIRFVLNHCSRNNRERDDAIAALLQYELKLLPAFLRESPCYRSAMDIGKAPNEVPYAIPKAAAVHLAQCISDALEAQFANGSMEV